MSDSLYPWQLTSWQKLTRAHDQARLPHATLLLGPKGTGKASFSRLLAEYILCASPSNARSCGSCKSCRLYRAGTHPDLQWVTPEQGSAVIKIDQVRAMVAKLGKTAQQGGARVVIMDPADALNLNAANAVLKSLEEPGAKVFFLLLSHRLGRIPATVVSRCSKVNIGNPTEQETGDWLRSKLDRPEELELLLNLSGGAPLAALALTQGEVLAQRQTLIKGLLAVISDKKSTTEVAQQWQSFAPETVLDWLQLWIEDIIRLSVTGDAADIKNLDLHKALTKISQHIRTHELYSYLDNIAQCRNVVLSGHNLNNALMYENLLIAWEQCCRG